MTNMLNFGLRNLLGVKSVVMVLVRAVSFKFPSSSSSVFLWFLKYLFMNVLFCIRDFVFENHFYVCVSFICLFVLYFVVMVYVFYVFLPRRSFKILVFSFVRECFLRLFCKFVHDFMWFVFKYVFFLIFENFFYYFSCMMYVYFVYISMYVHKNKTLRNK